VHLDVPAVPVDTIRFQHPGGETTVQRSGMFRVVRREDFDHALLRAVRARGVQIAEDEPVVDLIGEHDAVRVVTRTRERRARVVIGADGARSLVRRRLVGRSAGQLSVALDLLTQDDPASTAALRDHTAVFDFRCVADGVRGYAWDFPSVKNGTPAVNRGIGAVAGSGDRSLASALRTRLEALGVGFREDDVEGAPVPLYHPATAQSSARVVLAGDAVGVDPCMAEGISVAIGTGMVAAHAVADAFERDDFRFDDFTERIARSSIGCTLRQNWLAAGVFYRQLASGTPPPFPASGLA